MKYLVTPGIAAICYINDEAHGSRPWEGACAVYMDKGKPIEYSGPFALPPQVQASLRTHFEKVFELPADQRAAYLASTKPWTVEVLAEGEESTDKTE